jgi:hypothetical protein
MPGTGARSKHRVDSLQHTSCRSSPFMPGTGARANELRSKPIKTQTLRPEAGLLQMPPVDTTPLCPERVPERSIVQIAFNTQAVGAHLYAQNGCQSE